MRPIAKFYTALLFLFLFAIGLVWTGAALYQERKSRNQGKTVK